MTTDTPAPSEKPRPSSETLIARKEQWAKDRRGLIDSPNTTVSHPAGRPRLPPGQHLTKGLPILDLGTQPNLLPKDWSLTAGGLIAQPLRWSWDDLMRQPQTTLTADIHCVTAWSSYDNTFTGVSGRHFLQQVMPRKDACFVMARSFDGYSTNIPLSVFAEDGVLLCHSWNGSPLPRDNGGPVRLLIPRLYFWKSAKWIRHLTFMDRDQPGYWEARGYHMLGDPWRQQRYTGSD